MSADELRRLRTEGRWRIVGLKPTIASLEFETDGRVRIFWNDQDRLFWGHTVVTDIGLNGEYLESGMQ